MNIEEKLARRNDQDVIDIGMVAQELLEGERGKLLYALTNGKIWQDLKIKGEAETYEDKCELVGKLRSYVEVIESIEKCVLDMNAVLEERKRIADEKLNKEEVTDIKYFGTGII